MSIFPKRTIQGSTITIHWNFNTAHLTDRSIFPFVRFGVTDPLGHTIILHEGHLLALPSIQDDDESSQAPLYLNKNLPLLVTASYLSGRQPKEQLVEILQNIQAGRHYYFTYAVPLDAPLGKYVLVSEVHSEGTIRMSKTAEHDFFMVEKVSITNHNDLTLEATITNESPASTPAKIIDYEPGKTLTKDRIQVFEMEGNQSREIKLTSRHAYLSYNEERQLVPIFHRTELKVLRNQFFLQLIKKQGSEVYLLHPESQESHELKGPYALIWAMADGVRTRDEIRQDDRMRAYDDLIDWRLITEM